MAIYIITGETGEYEDWMKWNVGAFMDKMSCDEYLKMLKKYLSDNNIPSECTSIFLNPDKKQFSCSLDSKLKKNVRYYGVEYKVEKVKVLDSKIKEEI